MPSAGTVPRASTTGPRAAMAAKASSGGVSARTTCTPAGKDRRHTEPCLRQNSPSQLSGKALKVQQHGPSSSSSSLHPLPLSLTSALSWEGSVTALTLVLPSTDHGVKTLGGLAPYFRGHALANGYGQPWLWPASSKMPGEKPYFRDLAPHYSVL